MRTVTKLLMLAVASFAVILPAFALGPVDGEVEALYWFSDAKSSMNGNSSSDSSEAPGARAQVWFFGWGVAGAYYKAEPEGGNVEYTSLDLERKLIKPTDNTFLAIGLGWQNVNVSIDGMSTDLLDTSGARLNAEGRIGFAGFAYAYARGAYFIDLDDYKFSDGLDTYAFTSGGGHEYEVGVGFEPLPFLSLWAGYRVNKVDFDLAVSDVPVGSIDFKTDGFKVGAGVHF